MPGLGDHLLALGGGIFGIDAGEDHAGRRSEHVECLIKLPACCDGRIRTDAVWLRSFRLDVGRPDHLAPLLCFVRDELTKIGRRAGAAGETSSGKASL